MEFVALEVDLVLYRVLLALPIRDVIRCAEVSLYWYGIAVSNELWKSLYHKHIGLVEKQPAKSTWKEYFRHSLLCNQIFDQTCYTSAELFDENLTACTQNLKDLAVARCAKNVNTLDRYYWELKVGTFNAHPEAPLSGYIKIGVCDLPPEESTSSPIYWMYDSKGYVGRTRAPLGNGVSYGPTFGTGDTIGVLLDNKKHTISFFKNGRDHGVACFYVMGKLFPVVSLQGNVSVTFLQYPQVNLPSGFFLDSEGHRPHAFQRLIGNMAQFG